MDKEKGTLLTEEEIEKLVNDLFEQEDILDFCHFVQKALWWATIFLTSLIIISVLLGGISLIANIFSFITFIVFAWIARRNARKTSRVLFQIIDIEKKLNWNKE